MKTPALKVTTVEINKATIIESLKGYALLTFCILCLIGSAIIENPIWREVSLNAPFVLFLLSSLFFGIKSHVKEALKRNE